MTCSVNYFYPLSISLLQGKKYYFNPHFFYSPETFFIVIIDLQYWLAVNIINFHLQLFSSGIELRTLHLYITNITHLHTYDLPPDHWGLLVLDQFIQYIAQFEIPHIHPIAVFALQNCISFNVIFLTYLHTKNEIEIYSPGKQVKITC